MEKLIKMTYWMGSSVVATTFYGPIPRIGEQVHIRGILYTIANIRNFFEIDLKRRIDKIDIFLSTI
jgi:hypothetical protein